MAEIQFPQYPVQEGPSFSSIAQRQRMLLDDAMIADQEQKARTQKVAVAGGKTFVGYDKMLRGFMEAKYANPELKFWDYASNPTTGAAYRLQGRTKIAKDIEAGVDPKDIPGMNFIERQKAGLKGVFGKDAPLDLKSDAPIVESLKESGQKKVAEAGMGLDPVPGDAMAAQLEYDDMAANLAKEEAAKGGLKSTLGKVAGGVGAGISIASGAQRLQSEDEMTRLGGALQVGGGVAGAVALTNFWNPVGWAAAVPAALSIGGGLIGGGSNDMLGRTPIGRARRRLNIS
jgi:hypothetical protein